MTSGADGAPALAAFGYTARQAAFLALVARHGGYFLRRQYVAFTGHPHGLATVRFLRQLVARRHARLVPMTSGHAFHICARPLYAALADEHNRNRRAAEWEAVARKLLTIDFALSRRDDTFYATEAEKSAHLDSLRTGRDLWPSRVYAAHMRGAAPTTRYFVDKMPWHRMPDEPRLWFAYVDTEQTLAGFETFLVQYRPLLSVLSCGVTYVARSADSRAVTTLFSRVLARRIVMDPTVRDLLVYFRVRRDLEDGRRGYTSRDEMRRFVDLSSYFGVAFEDLYAAWPRLPHDANLDSELRSHRPLWCQLRIQQLDHRAHKI
jgi:hypothetical protein